MDKVVNIMERRQNNCSIPMKQRMEMIQLFIRVRQKYLERINEKKETTEPTN